MLNEAEYPNAVTTVIHGHWTTSPSHELTPFRKGEVNPMYAADMIEEIVSTVLKVFEPRVFSVEGDVAKLHNNQKKQSTALVALTGTVHKLDIEGKSSFETMDQNWTDRFISLLSNNRVQKDLHRRTTMTRTYNE